MARLRERRGPDRRPGALAGIHPLPRRAVLLLLAGPPLLLPRAAAAQAPGPAFSIDLQPVGAALSFAVPRGSRLVGVELGLGGNVLDHMIVGGRHFAEDVGVAYEARDVQGGKLLFEMASASLFVRTRPAERWTLDAGIRASGFLHLDASDDDPGGGLFVGGYAQPMWGSRRFKVGPRLLVGAFMEQDGLDSAELGVHLAALVGRITFGG